MKNYIRNLIPLIALVFISLACQAQRKRVTASEFRSGWNHHISPRCFKSELAYIEYNGIKYKISPRIIGYCAVEQEVDFDSYIEIADSSIKKIQNTGAYGVIPIRNGKGKYEAVCMFLNLGEELCKKPGNTLFVRVKAKVRLKHKRAPIVITYKFFEGDEKTVHAREKIERWSCRKKDS